MQTTEAASWCFCFFCITSFFGSARSECRGISSPLRLTNVTGNITSPGYPGNHPTGQGCQWIFDRFQPGYILQIQVRTLSLHSWLGIGLARSYITLPTGEELEGELQNICGVYGLNETLVNCSNHATNSLENCTYNQLAEDILPPSLKFRSTSYPFASRGSFQLEYKIYNCEEGSDQDLRLVSESTYVLVTSQSPTTHNDVTSKMDMTSYIVAPSAIAIFIFLITIVSVVVFFRHNRKHRLEQIESDRAENTYGSPLRWQGAHPTFSQSHRERLDSLRDSIRVETDLNRQDMASYISHSQLVQYPNQRVEIKEEVPHSSSDPEYMNFVSSPVNSHQAEDNDHYVPMSPIFSVTSE